VHAVSLAVAFMLLTIVHVVLGELVPKSISLQRAGRVALLVARPFQWYLGVFRPAIGLLEGVSRWILSGLGLSGRQSHTLVHSAEELQIQIQQARERGLIGVEEEKLILGAIELDELQVRELMVPRPDVHSVTADAGLDDVMYSSLRSARGSRCLRAQGTTSSDIFTLKTSYGYCWTASGGPRRAGPHLSSA
jgi:putative hemolysin